MRGISRHSVNRLSDSEDAAPTINDRLANNEIEKLEINQEGAKDVPLCNAIASCESLRRVFITGDADFSDVLDALGRSPSKLAVVWVSGGWTTARLDALVGRPIDVYVTGDAPAEAALNTLCLHPHAGWISLNIKSPIGSAIGLDQFRMHQPQLSIVLYDLLQCEHGSAVADGLLENLRTGRTVLEGVNLFLTEYGGALQPRRSDALQRYFSGDDDEESTQTMNEKFPLACLRSTALAARFGTRTSGEALVSFMSSLNPAFQVPAKEFTRDHPHFLDAQDVVSLAKVNKQTAAGIQEGRRQDLGTWLVYQHQRGVPQWQILEVIEDFPEAAQLKAELERLEQGEKLSFPLTKW